jgi:hypothetical protein
MRHRSPPHLLQFYFVGNQLFGPVGQHNGPAHAREADNALHIRIHFVLVLGQKVLMTNARQNKIKCSSVNMYRNWKRGLLATDSFFEGKYFSKKRRTSSLSTTVNAAVLAFSTNKTCEGKKEMGY